VVPVRERDFAMLVYVKSEMLLGGVTLCGLLTLLFAG
jgi:hypothetical protein